MRFSIEISPEQHQRLKNAAALRGKTIRDHILEKALADEEKRTALQVRKKSMQQQKKATRKK